MLLFLHANRQNNIELPKKRILKRKWQIVHNLCIIINFEGGLQYV